MPRFVSICLSDLLVMFFFNHYFILFFIILIIEKLVRIKKMRTNWNLSIKSVATW